MSQAVERFTGSDTDPWPAQWTTANSTGGSSTIDGNRGKQVSSSSGGYNDSRAERLNSWTAQNGTARGTFMVTDHTLEVFGEIYFRGDSTLHSNSYLFSLEPNISTNSIYFAKYESGSYSSPIGSAANFTFANNTIYAWEVRFKSTTLEARVWEASGSRPSSPNVSITDSTFSAAGYLGLGINGGSAASARTIYWDDYVAVDTWAEPAAGTTAAVCTISGNATVVSGTVYDASGTVQAVAGASGNVTIAHYGVAGTVDAVAGVSGAVTAILQASGTCDAVTGVSGAVTSGLLASGTSAAVATVSGNAVVTGKPGQTDELLVLFSFDEVLAGGRITYYQFDLLDGDEHLVGQLQGVESGDLSIDAYSAVKGSGKLSVYTDPAYSYLPDGQPDFLGVQVNTPLGPEAVLTATSTELNYVDVADADAVEISLEDRVILTDSGDQPKESTAFTVVGKSSSAGTTTITFTPDAATEPESGDILKVVEVGNEQVVDWLNARIRPMIRISRLGGGDDPDGRVVPAGVFLCAAPVEQWSSKGLRRDIELIDKLSILDQDIASGDPDEIAAYTADSGDNIIELIKELIEETGESTPAIQPDTKTLAAPLVWDIGTTRLKIVNDLLDAAGYFSLWCDGWGQYQAVPYVQPSDRVPVYESLAPFSDGPASLMDPSWKRDRDIYSIPNRYLVVGQGDGENAALTSLATNTNSESPYSYSSRGRWITHVEIGVEAADQDALDTIAAARLSRATSVTNQLTVKHVFLPDLHINSVVKFVNPDSGLDIYCYVVNTSIPLDPTGLCTTVMRVVA